MLTSDFATYPVPAPAAATAGTACACLCACGRALSVVQATHSDDGESGADARVVRIPAKTNIPKGTKRPIYWDTESYPRHVGKDRGAPECVAFACLHACMHARSCAVAVAAAAVAVAAAAAAAAWVPALFDNVG
jgi:hypothetical protein